MRCHCGTAFEPFTREKEACEISDDPALPAFLSGGITRPTECQTCDLKHLKQRRKEWKKQQAEYIRIQLQHA